MSEYYVLKACTPWSYLAQRIYLSFIGKAVYFILRQMFKIMRNFRYEQIVQQNSSYLDLLRPTTKKLRFRTVKIHTSLLITSKTK